MAMNRREFAIRSSLGVLGSMLLGCGDTKKFPFKKNQVIACFGDSVTYAGKKGYVELLQKLANEKRPDLNLTFLNWGKSSETITGLTEKSHPGPRPYLFERLDGLLESTPIDIAFFCYGINCGIYGKPSPALFDSYKIGIYSFLEKMKQRNIKTVLLTPPPLALDTAPIPLDPNTEYSWQNPYPKYEEEVLQEFKNILLQIDHEVILDHIDIHTPLLKNQMDYYTKDPIHPNAKGNQLIAETIVNHLRF